ncbi:MAG: GMC family oxidoreductase N-terminal domain-containing protein, partial [Actinomycetota bacterium]
VAAFAQALLPGGDDLPMSAAEAGVAERIDASMPSLDAAVRRNVARLITMVDMAPLFTRGRRLSKMSPASAAAYVERALGARNMLVRTAYNLLKVLCVNEFASTPRFEEAIGFTYGCVTRDPPRDAAPLEVIAYPAVDRDHTEDCDVVVVGSGAGGAAVAKELAESGLSVIVIEEGAHFTRADFAGPPWERVRRLYRANGSTVALGRPVIPIPVGKAVGGTTLVNAGTCFRTPDRILKQWSNDFSIQGLDATTMRPIFERVERILHVQPIPEEIIGENARVFRRGVEALGLHGAPIERNISGCRGCGVCVFGCPSDAKQSTQISYLPRAQRAGASIYARCRAQRILVHGGRARGIVAQLLDEAGAPRATLTVRSKAVVVAAGALHTPALLQANALAARSGMLGRNLRIHPATALGAIFDEPVYSWRGTLQSFYVDDWHDTEDIMIEVTSSVPGVAAGSLPGAGPQLANLLSRMPHVASAGLFVSDTSSGRVRRRRHGEPLVTYRLNDADARKMADGMARIAEIFLAAGARAVFTGLPSIPWITGRDNVGELRERGARAQTLKLTAFHPVGTA